MWWHQARPAALVPRRRASAAVTARANQIIRVLAPEFIRFTGCIGVRDPGYGRVGRTIYPGASVSIILYLVASARDGGGAWFFAVVASPRGRARSGFLARFQFFKLQASFEAGSLLTRFGVSRRRRPLAIGVAIDRIGRVCYSGPPGSCAHFPWGRRRSRGVTGVRGRGPSRAKFPILGNG